MVSAGTPGTGAAFAQWLRTGDTAAAAAGDMATAPAAPASASEAPATVTPASILNLAMFMPVIVPAGAETPLKRH